mmetsp:Transcript_53802/g.61642  ORF Transcript_53802/g.61642 Transcript_53802/m.61642 type:complete len:117 (+) Transcript_53802:456-806(+)|eukprot:CAMPEP_0115010502 /NCGR_PEP_ID=MMETSP0216-20121206/23355_1 /TAXON_ID=223996 /ORGANISM="Protocruzia adherens, Strain Boccale" /LENGTH=116 /DNA_ID=CAMNT_0002378731 /DNA_START=360 /DNA_END=710 /DNA_ORIENTATION=+
MFKSHNLGEYLKEEEKIDGDTVLLLNDTDLRDWDYQEVISTDAGGERMMLHEPGSIDELRRSQALKKVKKLFDAKATDIRHDLSKDGNADATVALFVEWPMVRNSGVVQDFQKQIA